MGLNHLGRDLLTVVPVVDGTAGIVGQHAFQLDKHGHLFSPSQTICLLCLTCPDQQALLRFVMCQRRCILVSPMLKVRAFLTVKKNMYVSDHGLCSVLG